MKRRTRRMVFETNSSSTHSLTMCPKEEYEKWKNGELLLDNWKDKFVEATEENLEDEDNYTYDRYWDEEYLETFEQSCKTKSGEEIIAFGKYGYDG